ncbi:MAG TPA: hypothetical protein DHV30_15570 [Balneola sp.]|nr:hypothetical protein [Balneola sp.]|tara:strand:+ start:961 stop:1155 length:195 start_codon:yes stop_codon:yes gene_type:complete
MNLDDALALTQRFPEDKTVPEKLADAIKKSSGYEKKMLIKLGEGVILDATTKEERKLVQKFLMS